MTTHGCPKCGLTGARRDGGCACSVDYAKAPAVRLTARGRREFRVAWSPCPTDRHAGRVEFVLATTERDAVLRVTDRVERERGVTDFVVTGCSLAARGDGDETTIDDFLEELSALRDFARDLRAELREATACPRPTESRPRWWLPDEDRERVVEVVHELYSIKNSAERASCILHRVARRRRE